MGHFNRGLFRGAEKLLICCPGCNRSPGRPLNCWVFRGAGKLLSCEKMFSRGPTVYGFCFPVCRRTSRKFSVCRVSCPACHRAPGRSSDWCLLPICPVYRELLGYLQAVVFRGADLLVISCSVRLWCQLLNCSECRTSSGMAQDMVSIALGAVDPQLL